MQDKGGENWGRQGRISRGA